MLRAAIVVLSILTISSAQAEPAPKRVGGDRDKHGCLASAGYLWCAKTARCERPWELAKAKGFENTVKGFRTYCTK